MEPALITAIVGGLVACGGGAWRLIDRADKKRERREVAVEALLTARIAELVKRVKALARYNSRIKAAAGKWREQLIANDIQPDPADWPEGDHDDTE
ncbi:hypothetical protein [Paenarthrobacter nitroguajacolicus]|uniref:hypothetical protein n=1 Tax=Paenarthrobacter nitroguajacolicus TaxID=211146 RepID=UPI00248AE26A|nr:hypothetical protein [Paenarthrobacter nitroguajacolicus]MDI2033005.1 hypothetical protein [Paenarthrobacter nitroguajacolicus]